MGLILEAVRLVKTRHIIRVDWSHNRSVVDTWALNRGLQAAIAADDATKVRAIERDIHKLYQSLDRDVDHDAERESLRVLRLARSTAAMARLAARERGEAWKREPRQVCGPVKSYLPVMDREEQLEAGHALGRHRDLRQPDLAAQVVSDVAHNSGEHGVCTAGKVALRPRNRRGTRGKGRQCKR